MDIKSLKPTRGRYNQGYINVNECKKVFNNLRNEAIIYRSSYEKLFIKWLESCPEVKNWGSECIYIYYYSPLDSKKHRYFPDFVFDTTDGKRYVIEIKPANQTIRPTNNNPYSIKQWITNKSKWTAMKRYCDEMGWHFKILTERTLFGDVKNYNFD